MVKNNKNKGLRNKGLEINGSLEACIKKYECPDTGT